MDGMFYFNSPQISYSPPRRSPYYHNSAFSGKKRKSEAMDGFRAHACMAVLDEPTFCPSEISVLFPEYSWNFHGLSGDASLPTPDLTEDEDEDDSGGVPLFDQEDAEVTTIQGNVSDTEAQPDSDRASQDATPPAELGSGPIARTDHDHFVPLERAVLSRIQPGESTVLGTAHPRPHTQELWVEEDSRRLLFALDGFDIDEVPRFLLETAAFTRSEEPVAVRTGLEATSTRPPLTLTPDVILALTESRLLPAVRNTGPEVSEPDSLHDRSVAADPVDMEVEEWLPVDDPRREYDVADFLDHWRLRSVTRRDVIPHTVGIQPSLRLRRPPEHLARHDIASDDLDWQGIRWKLIGPDRQHVLAARIQMHPSSPVALARSGRPASHVLDAPSAYRFRGFTPQHRARTSHYQLRNVLAATSRADVFYATGNKVMRTSLACPTMRDPAVESGTAANLPTDFRVMCLAAYKEACTASFMVAGGFNGEYALLKVGGAHGAAIHDGHVTHAYNGLVTHANTVTGRRGTPQTVFCSNDHHVRLLDVETLRIASEFVYPSAINCSATAPDKRLRAIVGDCRDAYITNAERGEVLVTLSGHTDHGFACAWSSNGVHVASGAQDGKTLVWDARNWSQPLQKLPNDGALVVAENDDIISIYDPQTFNKRQDLRFVGSVAGVALLDGGEEIAVANTDKSVGGLLTFERLPGPVYSDSGHTSAAYKCRPAWYTGVEKITYSV
ncbi:hypothetical protein LTR78_004420 [Recurvomyces mirabilis]|uniref:Uncharacterized protein n=1 Tax=Recurvomyces mirabilis TaxID=574656 RepID=A0AAE0WQ42_9PEZI|nr:hypothetical protein LTR78_004420 [Recurvomyces mirabilis]